MVSMGSGEYCSWCRRVVVEIVRVVDGVVGEIVLCVDGVVVEIVLCVDR